MSFRDGDAVYYCAASQAFPSGNKVVYGEHGKVVRLVSSEEVAVLFPDNKGALDCPVTQLSRKGPPPPLAGSLNVNDTVYFNAGAVSFTDGDRVEPGHKGKVTGPHPSKPAKVMVRFAGNKGIISCFATDVSRCWPPEPAQQAAMPASPTRQLSKPFVTFVSSLGGAAARAATAIQSRWRGNVCRRAARLLAGKADAVAPVRDPLRIFEKRAPAVKKKPPAKEAAGSSSRSTGTVSSVADEVAKLKQLLDSGVLTAAEFEEAKRRELNRR